MQHSIEYWLTLDLLLSRHDLGAPCRLALLVDNPKDADLYFVPFFSSLSYNRYTRPAEPSPPPNRMPPPPDKNVRLQEELVRLLSGYDTWTRSGGKDHVIVMHHPNSLHVVRERLHQALFIVSDFGRYHPDIANAGKDVVAPYKHMVPTFVDDDSSFTRRKTLLFFQGAIVRKGVMKIMPQLFKHFSKLCGFLLLLDGYDFTSLDIDSLPTPHVRNHWEV